MSRKVGLRDVAKAAQVSAATVSRIANGNPSVDASIRQRVLAAAQQLGLDLARIRRNRSIAFLLGNRDLLNEFQARLLLGAESLCSQREWDLRFLCFRSDLWAPGQELSLPPALKRLDRPGGIVLGGTHPASMLRALDDAGIPFAVMGNNIVGKWDPSQCDCMWSDDIGGARQLTKHLIDQGHRDIWYIGNSRLPWYTRCGEGYRSAMHDARLEPNVIEIHSEDGELGYLAAKSLLANGKRVTAVFAGNDQAAAGVFRAFQEGGVRVPHDISVVGFNDTVGASLYPALTTAREFPEELGRHLAEMVLRRIQDPTAAYQRIEFPTQPVFRESVRPASSL
jgi:DNA-binding LacI/PurR family transcriptional regulator